MGNDVKQKLMIVYNTLNMVEVKGINNLANLANSINLLKEIIEAPEESQK